MKKAKEYELEEKIEELKSELQEKHKRALAEVTQEYNHIAEKYKNLKTKEYESYIWEA